jgi:uncharacterized protein (TIGR04551 family)
MKQQLRISGIVVLLSVALVAPAWAQQDEEGEPEPPPVSQEAEEESEDDAEAPDEDPTDEETTEETTEEEVEELDEPAEPPTLEEPVLPPVPGEGDEELDDDPFEDFDDFEAFDEDWDGDWDQAWPTDWDESILDRVTPQSAFPFVDVGGVLRTRSRVRIGFDLDTQGTSAVLPPLGTVVPTDRPATPDASTLWSTDLRLRLDPTFHISEYLRIHTDVDLLRNVALGADPRHSLFVDGDPSPDRRMMASSTGGPSTLLIRQAYGEVDAFFGTLQAGRMMHHWGLGIFSNDGSCTDCDGGDQVDRVALRTRLFGFYALAAWDFPDAGLVSRAPGFDTRREQELSGIDRAHQWTAAVYRAPLTREDLGRQAHRLGTQELPVLNGGLSFSHRSQTGAITTTEEVDPDVPPVPIYRGLRVGTLSPWAQFLWNPDTERRVRIELEGLVTLGRVDNATNDPVGFDEGTGAERDVNCFDEDSRAGADGACSVNAMGENTATTIRQIGLALESEFQFGGPVHFGVNGGFATGGDAPNWGWRATPAEQLDFTRFSPDYQVDLILFREVIGTVTNAYYANPYVVARFLDSGAQRMEFQLDAIGSRAFNAAGTPGGSPWLGLEFDGSLRFLSGQHFLASLDAGILFPGGGLSAAAGQDRLNYYGDLGPFISDQAARFAWTVQGRLIWSF